MDKVLFTVHVDICTEHEARSLEVERRTEELNAPAIARIFQLDFRHDAPNKFSDGHAGVIFLFPYVVPM